MNKVKNRDYHLATLKNGLRLITVPMAQMKSATVIVGVGAGSRYESREVNGLFHFLEHMAFKGTKKRPSTLKIASEIDGVGGSFNAFTDKEFTGYHIKLAADKLELAFDILSDMLTSSLFKPEEIEREKGVIIEEINMRDDTPMLYIYEAFLRLLYGDNPMGWDIAGERKTVRSIKRHDFMRFLKSLYFARNMVVCVAGGVKQAEVERLAQKYFSSLQKVGQKVTKHIKIKQASPRIRLFTKKTQQAHFCLGVPGYDLAHKDKFALGVLSTLLGGGMSSRLFLQIRERRGLAYYVGSDVDYYTDSGYLLARAGVKVEKIEEAIKVTLGELEKVKNSTVKALELKRAKEMMKGNLILSLEDSRNVASRYALQVLLEKRIRTPEEALALIDKVTTEDIQRVARDIFRPNKLNLAIIGPYKDRGRFNKLLGGKVKIQGR
jgi:predicted Zn-dependent peptidase